MIRYLLDLARRRWKWIASIGIAALVGLNLLAFMHARSFTHYAVTSSEKKKADRLDWRERLEVLLTGPTVPRPAIKRKPPFWTSYSTHTISSTDGVKLEAWYFEQKNAPAVVVMFHGYGASKSSLLDESKAFRGLGYSTLLVDFRGSGGSSGSVTTLGYREADDVVASLAYARTLAPNLPIFVYGSSMGAVAALQAMAIEGARPEGAVLECPFDSMLSTVENRFRIMEVPAFPAAELLVLWGGLQFGFNGFAHDARDYAERVTVPVVLIAGDLDRRATAEQVRSVYDHLAGPRQFEVFEGAGHGGYLQKDERRWLRLVGDFIGTLTKRAAGKRAVTKAQLHGDVP
jgi:alpha-beta hydrolase superfamily lysophospholipase